ncbi:MAG: acyl-CoA thioesterase [Candidatus Dadabacteria bacterium]|nr:acyl-CoA thioesterase [Candidatus Dadabacteria bacterium]MYE60814.1 acyl-CoA thioesterase [Candidatus Dadabacteria bacterium]MYI72868.1 acyl-CoA thioesterase [Candidatus Dadabacteria bacterium]
MISIGETANKMVQYVLPEHSNNHGTLHGGILMDWIMLTASITSFKFANGPAVLGATDSIDFLNPVKIGEIVVLESWVEYAGNSSIEVAVRVHSENGETEEKKLITLSYMAFVAVDENVGPRKIEAKLSASSTVEREIITLAEERKVRRLPEIKRRKRNLSNVADETESSRLIFNTTKMVLPEDAFYGKFMSVGKLMKYIDESAAILAKRFTKGVLVTGSLDDLFFYSPLNVGNLIEFKAGITHVGTRSLELAIKVDSYDTQTGESSHACTAFLTYVKVDEAGNPVPVPEFTPETPYEIRLWKEAEKRKVKRKARVERAKSLADDYLNEYKKVSSRSEKKS